MQKKTPLLLMILDGWGYSSEQKFNAIAQAYTPQWDTWWSTCPHTLIDASGTPVGLPNLQMGNSEVGHMHIGAGRVIEQDFTRINQSIANEGFFSNSVFLKMIQDLKAKNKSLHIMGLLSSGGVHSHEKHLFALLKLCADNHYNAVCLHLFLDGRDTPPQSALASLNKLKQEIHKYPIAKICSLSGRYYAMDRDNRWDRIENVYNLLTLATSDKCFDDAETAVRYYYEHHINDEFIPPTRIGNKQPIHDGDSILFFNFRADRARQLSTAFIGHRFTKFTRTTTPHLTSFISMTQYDENLSTLAAFPPQSIPNTIGEVLSKNKLTQLRIAETEKYAHITFFLNGGNETPFSGEERILIPSPKVATYDLQPEMSANQLTDKLIAALHQGIYDVIICNFANADMVGHTGNLDATIQAIECLDRCMKKINDILSLYRGQMLITADHGNAEEMYDDNSHQAHTAHTNKSVPLVYIGSSKWYFNSRHGSLADIAPTMLTLLGISPPSEMTGISLLTHDSHE